MCVVLFFLLPTYIDNYNNITILTTTRTRKTSTTTTVSSTNILVATSRLSAYKVFSKPSFASLLPFFLFFSFFFNFIFRYKELRLTLLFPLLVPCCILEEELRENEVRVGDRRSGEWSWERCDCKQYWSHPQSMRSSCHFH